jgi:O-antigen ligase
VALYGITHSGRGPGGFLHDENDLALGCVTAFPFAFFGFELSSGWRRWVSGALGTVLIVAVVISFSRGGFVGLVAVAVYCFFVSRHKVRNLAVLAVTAVAFLALAPSEYIDELKTIREVSSGTARGRQFLWTTAYNMWADHKVFGVGGDNFIFLAGVYQPNWEDRSYAERDFSGTTIHSAYFQMLSEQGVAGIAVCAYMIWAHFSSLRRLRKLARRPGALPPDLRQDVELYGGALAAAMLGFLASGAFLSVAYTPFPWYFAGLALALEISTKRELRRRRALADDSQRVAANPSMA